MTSFLKCSRMLLYRVIYQWTVIIVLKTSSTCTSTCSSWMKTKQNWCYSPLDIIPKAWIPSDEVMVNYGRSLINGLVTSSLDYYKGLLHGRHNNLIDELQCVQNTATRITTRTFRRSHITPVVQELHWLPVSYRIQN